MTVIAVSDNAYRRMFRAVGEPERGEFYADPHIHKVPRVYIIYAKPVPLLRNS
jgi:hypothetical protein